MTYLQKRLQISARCFNSQGCSGSFNTRYPIKFIIEINGTGHLGTVLSIFRTVMPYPSAYCLNLTDSEFTVHLQKSS